MELTTLNRQRGVIKTKIAKLKKFAETFTLSENPEEAEIIITSKLELLLETKISIKELTEKYISLPEKTEIKDSLSLIEEIDDEIEEIQVRLKILLSKLKLNNEQRVNESVNKTSKTSFKIPEMPLPIFSGKYEDYRNFKLQFMSIIGNNTDLNDTQKLFYLKASLRENAKLIETTVDSFESLFKALEARYDNQRAVIDAHVNNILNLERINESPSQLRNILDIVNRSLRALDVLEFQRNDLSDVLILNILLTKLDKESRKQFELTAKSNEVPKLVDFLNFLEERTLILEGLSQSNLHFQSQKHNYSKTHSNQPNRSRTLFVKSNQSLQNCIVCSKESHPIYRCEKFKEI